MRSYKHEGLGYAPRVIQALFAGIFEVKPSILFISFCKVERPPVSYVIQLHKSPPSFRVFEFSFLDHAQSPFLFFSSYALFNRVSMDTLPTAGFEPRYSEVRIDFSAAASAPELS